MQSNQTNARSFAVDVVRTLREAGYEALWAGGCVRDELLGLTPKDYDVATSARPEQIRKLFGFNRTLAIGAAFGVISVLGSREVGAIEVATFRCDGTYHDGRHPSAVTFSTAERDAQRRDFTINGLFYDPLQQQVHDFVGGTEDLKRGIIRAIGKPHERFQEDKLRMLRAVRFAATFDFPIEPATLQAIRELADELVIVSAERIAAEMRRILVHARRSLGVRLLQESGLLRIVIPEAVAFNAEHSSQNTEASHLRWELVLALLNAVTEPEFITCLALLLRGLCHLPADSFLLQHWLPLPQGWEPTPSRFAECMCRRWKLSNQEVDGVAYLIQHEGEIMAAREIAWPRLQRLLTGTYCRELLAFSRAVSRVTLGNEHALEYCEQKLRLPPEELNPEPILSGSDLIQAGLKPGPLFKTCLEQIREAQLEKRIHTRDEALSLAKQITTPS